MTTFTLDTNCVIDVDENRDNAVFIMQLADAHLNMAADVSVVAMMASEKQKSGGYLTSFKDFSARLDRLGLSHLGLCLPLCYFNISFFNCCLLSGPEQRAVEQQIHNILFPDIEFNYRDFCRSNNLDPNVEMTGKAHKWRNAKCDVQSIWSHFNKNREIFVTSDRNFLIEGNCRKLLALGSGQILMPSEAVSLIP